MVKLLSKLSYRKRLSNTSENEKTRIVDSRPFRVWIKKEKRKR
uniref:Uncharacterized protein n=2 Tax=Enterococcus TaxID=1350 RepID=A0A286KC75_ENTAV|nr:hypothetical protein pEMA120_p62 [Enterococcus faecium]APB62518.1 hypothetical protein pEA19081_p22 [Enterococcus avium]